MKRTGKRILMVVALVAVLVMGLTATSFAAPHRRNALGRARGTAVCRVADCTQEGWHRHGRRQYDGGYHKEDDRRYPLCTVEGCEQRGPHQHDGESYCGWGCTHREEEPSYSASGRAGSHGCRQRIPQANDHHGRGGHHGGRRHQ